MFPYDANMSTIVQEPRRVWKRFVQKWGLSCRSNDGQPAISMSAVFNKGFFPLFSLPRSLSLHPSLPPPSSWLEGLLAATQTLTDRCPWWSRTRSA